MSLIVCTNDCVYQQDGYCILERAASSGATNNVAAAGAADLNCVYFIKRSNGKVFNGDNKSLAI